MLITALIRSLTQLTDPKILKILMQAVLVAVGLFAAATLVVVWLTSLIPETGTDWIDTWLEPLKDLGVPAAMMIAGYFIFPALVTIGLSFFMDQVIDAVEARHYPSRRANRQVGFFEDLWIGIRLLIVMVVVNILVLPIYITLLVTGIGAPLLYLAINAYLLGREYFELVAIRHMSRAELDVKRKERGFLTWVAGFLIAVIFFIPIANLLAPIVGASLMTHVVQRRALPPIHK